MVFLIRHNMPEGVKDSTGWLTTQHSGIATATVLMPFAGISFLWFIGVVRDGLGRFEDRFFASVLLGSGLLFLAMMFVATAIAAALVASKGVIDPAAHTEVIDFGKFVVLAITKTYAIRMAAVFMMSLATIWRKTGLMPRWLVAISYLVAVGLLIIRRPEHVGGDGLPGVGTGGQRLDTGPPRTLRPIAGRPPLNIAEPEPPLTPDTGYVVAPRKHSSLLPRLYFHEIA